MSSDKNRTSKTSESFPFFAVPSSNYGSFFPYRELVRATSRLHQQVHWLSKFFHVFSQCVTLTLFQKWNGLVRTSAWWQGNTVSLRWNALFLNISNDNLVVLNEPFLPSSSQCFQNQSSISFRTCMTKCTLSWLCFRWFLKERVEFPNVFCCLTTNSVYGVDVS